jgi:hypothetical protein
MGRASNKGVVGLSVRFRGVSLALISAHFASDANGRNRLAHRNRVRSRLEATPRLRLKLTVVFMVQDASAMLRELSLLWDEAYDVHLLHHHW